MEDRTIEQFNRIAQVSDAYYTLIDKVAHTEREFESWLSSLKEPMQSDLRKKGYGYCYNILNFHQYCLEMEDYGMDEFMKSNLSPEDFNVWVGNE